MISAVGTILYDSFGCRIQSWTIYVILNQKLVSFRSRVSNKKIIMRVFHSSAVADMGMLDTFLANDHPGTVRPKAQKIQTKYI